MKLIKFLIPFIIWTLLSLLLYHKVFNAPFILDDNWYIATNQIIKNITTLILDFSGTRYIGFLTFAINYYLNGLNTYGYHIVNILIHVLNTSLVYFLIQITLNRLKDIDFRLNCRQQNITCHPRMFLSGIWFYLHKTIFPLRNSAGMTNVLKTVEYKNYLNYLPFTVSLIFLVHPIQTQAVSYISQRFTSLATLFYLLAIILYVKNRLNYLNHSSHFLVPYILSILSTILAMKTKEISFTLPFIILLYEFTFLNNNPLSPFVKGEGKGINPPLLRGIKRGLFSFAKRDFLSAKRLIYLIPFFLTLAIIPLSLFWSMETDTLITGTDVNKELGSLHLQNIKQVPVYIYLLTQFRIIITYIRLMIIPINQHFQYDYPLSNSIFESATLISFLVLLSIISFAVYLFIQSRRTNNTHGLLISFGTLWFFITLSVESSIIPIRDVIFEHRLYLPSIGFILSISTAILHGVDYLGDKIKRPLYIYLLAMVFIITGIFSFATYKRNVLWGDILLLYLDEVKKSPNKPEPHYKLGVVYDKDRQINKAAYEYQTALKLKPDYAEPHNNMGSIYNDQGRLEDALREYQAALKSQPNYVAAYYNLGNLYDKKGMTNEAISAYKKAFEIDPSFAAVYINLALVYRKIGLTDEAIAQYNEALKHSDKHNPISLKIIYQNMGGLFDEMGLIDKAISAYKKALEIDSAFAEAYINLAMVYRKTGLSDEAITQYKEALKHIDNPSILKIIYQNMGSVFGEKGRIDEAITAYKEALKLDSKDADSHYNLAVLYTHKGFADNAVNSFLEAIKTNPDDSEAHYRLGLIYLQKSLLDKAIIEFQEALRIKPDYREAEQQLERLRLLRQLKG